MKFLPKEKITLFKFIFLGTFAWGTSYFWIKIALLELSPFEVVFYRLLTATVVIWTIIFWQKRKVLWEKQFLKNAFFLGLLNTLLPFLLISWAETHVPSALVGVLNALTPLMTFLILFMLSASEKVLKKKTLAGLLIGFFGVCLILNPSACSTEPLALWGYAASILAALSYAGAAVFTQKKLKGKDPLITAAAAISFSALLLLITALFTAKTSFPALTLFPTHFITFLAIIWLGGISTGLSYAIYLSIIKEWGASRTSLVTYVITLTSFLLGVLFLGEKVGLRDLIGVLMLLSGIYLVTQVKRVKVSY